MSTSTSASGTSTSDSYTTVGSSTDTSLTSRHTPENTGTYNSDFDFLGALSPAL